ncbi:MAG: cysteine desulfurase, partial [Vicinamibacterales bacterium]
MNPGIAAAVFDVQRVRADFPILTRTINGRPLAYLDNAATTQKPRVVLDAITSYYTDINANVHRGVHELSARATDAYEGARERIRAYFNAASVREIVYTRNATEGINLVAFTFARARLGPGDEVLISAMEHHSNIVPWQLVCEATGAKLSVAPIDDRGELILEEFDRLLSPRTRIAAVTHMSNALGTVTPVAQLVRMAHAKGVPILIDASQAAYHMRVDVQALDCDFLVATGHKLYGPTGIGVLYGREAHLEAMPPFMGGGDMISSVTFERSTWNVLPYKFEAGTPDIAGAVGLHAALDYIESVGFDAIAAHERDLMEYGTAMLGAIDGVRLIGTARNKASILSFVMDDV